METVYYDIVELILVSRGSARVDDGSMVDMVYVSKLLVLLDTLLMQMFASGLAFTRSSV